MPLIIHFKMVTFMSCEFHRHPPSPANKLFFKIANKKGDIC